MSSDHCITPRVKEPASLDSVLLIPGTTQRIPIDDKSALGVLILSHIKRAGEGHPDSMYALGVLFEHQGPSNEVPVEAAGWYLKAAQQGHADAMYQLGLCFQCGYGVERDDVQAVEWFRKAIKRVHVPSLTRMGIAFMSGEGVDRDWEQAVTHFTAAALKGEPKAQMIIGGILQQSDDPDSQQKAFKWFSKAAEGGESSAMLEIGRMLVDGIGTIRDQEKGIQWLSRAAEEGEEEAASLLERIQRSGNK